MFQNRIRWRQSYKDKKNFVKREQCLERREGVGGKEGEMGGGG
jgi:hypothetical protein